MEQFRRRRQAKLVALTTLAVLLILLITATAAISVKVAKHRYLTKEEIQVHQECTTDSMVIRVTYVHGGEAQDTDKELVREIMGQVIKLLEEKEGMEDDYQSMKEADAIEFEY